jgi:hypothetical protein
MLTVRFIDQKFFVKPKMLQFLEGLSFTFAVNSFVVKICPNHFR